MVRTVAARANRPRRNFSRPPSGRAAPVPAAAGRRSAARRSPRPLLHPHRSFARRNRSQRRRIEPSRSPHQARTSRRGSADSSRRRLRPALSDLRAASPTFIPPPRPPPHLRPTFSDLLPASDGSGDSEEPARREELPRVTNSLAAAPGGAERHAPRPQHPRRLPACRAVLADTAAPQVFDGLPAR